MTVVSIAGATQEVTAAIYLAQKVPRLFDPQARFGRRTTPFMYVSHRNLSCQKPGHKRADSPFRDFEHYGIAYTSRESGPNEVYVRPFPGGTASGSGKWQISSDGGSSAIWARNGRELFYQSPDNHIMAAAYTANADSFAADKPRPWSNTQIFEPVPLQWNFDLAPDGKRFAVIPRPEAAREQKGSVHVTVLLNFFDELRRRVPL